MEEEEEVEGRQEVGEVGRKEVERGRGGQRRRRRRKKTGERSKGIESDEKEKAKEE